MASIIGKDRGKDTNHRIIDIPRQRGKGRDRSPLRVCACVSDTHKGQSPKLRRWADFSDLIFGMEKHAIFAHHHRKIKCLGHGRPSGGKEDLSGRSKYEDQIGGAV